MAVRCFLCMAPPSGSLECNGWWKVSDCAYYIATFVFIKRIPLLILGGYVKDGMSSEAAGCVFDALAALS